MNIEEFGAKPNDGKDDTEAFISAIDSLPPYSVIEVSKGNFIVRKQLKINDKKISFRGVSDEDSTISFEVPLSKLAPEPRKNDSGEQTQLYSWSGGLISYENTHEIDGSFSTHSSGKTSKFLPSKKYILEVNLTETEIKSFLKQNNSDIKNLKNTKLLLLDFPISTFKNTTFPRLRSLNIDSPKTVKYKLLDNYGPSISNLKIKFPAREYSGHFKETGFNAISFKNTNSCNARNITIENADNAIFLESSNCLIYNIKINSKNLPEKNWKATGHHGIYVKGSNNKIQNIIFNTKFIHDVSVSRASFNLFKDISGKDLSLDFHKRHPFSNIFTDIDTGTGKYTFMSGGGRGIGPNTGPNTILMNIKPRKSTTLKENFFTPPIYATRKVLSMKKGVEEIPSKIKYSLLFGC